MPKAKARGVKKVMLWGGYSEGKLSYEIDKYQETRVAAVFFTRWEARKHYRDVRRVTLTEALSKPTAE